MTNDNHYLIREIKRLLRAAMSGPVSASMREQGLKYKLNFGVDQPRLVTIAAEVREIASEAEADLASVAADLWKEDIRECKILACQLMPAKNFSEELAEIWIEQIRYAEEAQAITMHLLVNEPFAADLSFRLVASPRPLYRLTGWLLFGRLFSKRKALAQRDADEWLDQISAELHDTTADIEIRKAALNALYKFMDLGEAEDARGERILTSLT